MPGRLFISCGQANDEEREAANALCEWLRSSGFDPYVAITTQSIQDVNHGIIDNLKRSDYYIFIDFPRERLAKRLFSVKTANSQFRGSLFTNQELAIAYVLGFEHVIFLKHRDVKLEGMNRYILSNAREFNHYGQVLDIVKEEIKSREWSPAYSRVLYPTRVAIPSQAFWYGDQAGRRFEYIWLVGIRNGTLMQYAQETAVRLLEITDPSGRRVASPDTRDLKWAGQQAYRLTLFPNSEEVFDAISIEDSQHDKVYLHSSADLTPRHPLIAGQRGKYVLHYRIYANGFNPVDFDLELNLTGNVSTTTAQLL